MQLHALWGGTKCMSRVCAWMHVCVCVCVTAGIRASLVYFGASECDSSVPWCGRCLPSGLVLMQANTSAHTDIRTPAHRHTSAQMQTQTHCTHTDAKRGHSQLDHIAPDTFYGVNKVIQTSLIHHLALCIFQRDTGKHTNTLKRLICNSYIQKQREKIKEGQSSLRPSFRKWYNKMTNPVFSKPVSSYQGMCMMMMTTTILVFLVMHKDETELQISWKHLCNKTWIVSSVGGDIKNMIWILVLYSRSVFIPL